MLTIERIFGPEALEELASIPLSPLEKRIGKLLLEVYADGVESVRHSQHDALPAHYRKIKLP